MKEFKKLCTPAKIYFVLAIIACIFALFNGIPILAIFLKLFFAMIWTYVLSWLCKKGYEGVSWFLVLMPYIMILLGMFSIIRMTKVMNSLLSQTK